MVPFRPHRRARRGRQVGEVPQVGGIEQTAWPCSVTSLSLTARPTPTRRAKLGLWKLAGLTFATLLPVPLVFGADPPPTAPRTMGGRTLQIRVRDEQSPSGAADISSLKPLRARLAQPLAPPQDEPPAEVPVPTPAAEPGSPNPLRIVAEPRPLTVVEPTTEAVAAEPATLAPSKVPSEVFAAQFQEVVPGETTQAKLIELFGPEAQKVVGPGSEIWTYRIGPFPRVEFRLEQEIVRTIRVVFADPMPRRQVIADLELADFDMAYLADEQGEVHAEAVPERGLQLTWSRTGEPPDITQILLEVPRASHFVKRAQQDPRQRYQRMLSDLAAARRLEPPTADGLTLEARIRQRLGQPQAALELATSAVELDPKSIELQLLRAKLLSENGRHSDALVLVDRVLSDPHAPDEWRAVGRYVRGELVLASPTGRAEQALENFQRSLAAAGKLTSAKSERTRAVARDVLFASYLGGAEAIAQSRFQGRGATVEKWWNSARELCQEADDSGQGGSLELWELQRRHLQLASLAGGRIPTQEIETLRIDARRLNQRADDPLTSNRIDWELAESLLHAAELAQANQLWPEALEYAEEGMQRAQAAAASREPGFATDYLLGRLAFLIASYHDVVSKDFEQRREWADQSARRFDALGSLPRIERVRHGERLVFLGKIYDTIPDRQAAIRWLTRGVEMLEPLVEEQLVAPQRVAEPLGMLAALQRDEGNIPLADQLATRAAKLVPTRSASRPRKP